MNIEERLGPGKQKGFGLMMPPCLKRCWLCDVKQEEELPEIGLCPRCLRTLAA